MGLRHSMHAYFNGDRVAGSLAYVARMQRVCGGDVNCVDFHFGNVVRVATVGRRERSPVGIDPCRTKMGDVDMLEILQ